MSYQVLARKYRPQRFSEVIGQEHVTRTLKNAIAQQRIAHGYIFSGHRGIGKTTIARILAMALNCRSQDHPVPEPCGVCEACTEIRAGGAVDVIEIDAATNRGIDEIRELRDAARYRPARDRYKIYILDEAHQITDAAFNALLKTLEEPPPHIIFMMATTQPEDIPQTIRSRCQHFNFHAVKFDEIVGQLRAIAKKEGVQAGDQALAVLAEAGDGSMRDALSIMDQAIAASGATLTAEQVRQLVGTLGSEVMEDLLATVARNSSEDALRLLDKFMSEGQNPAHFARQLVRFLRNALVAKVSGAESPLLQVSSDERARVGRVAAQFSEEDLARFLQIMLRTYDEIGYRQEQRFHLELGVLKMVHAQRLLPLEQILSQVAPQGAPAPARTPASPSVSRAPAPAASPGTQDAGGRTDDNRHSAEESPRRISPFEADRTRKSGPFDPQMSAAAAGTIKAQGQTQTDSPVATAVADPPADAMSGAAAQAPEAASDAGRILGCVITELENAGHKLLASALESGAAELLGEELRVTVAQTRKAIDLLMQNEQKRIAGLAASRAAGFAVKIEIISAPAGANGGAANGTNGSAGAAARPVREGPGARTRAANEPVVQRMQEKFGAEIRTVIDYQDKG